QIQFISMIKSSHFHALFLPVLVLLIAVMIWSVGYNTPRENFIFFISQYLVVFLSFYILWLKTESFSFFSLLSLAIGFRLILLFSIPELSNDFYRFIWDGELLNRGINPFAHKP